MGGPSRSARCLVPAASALLWHFGAVTTPVQALDYPRIDNDWLDHCDGLRVPDDTGQNVAGEAQQDMASDAAFDDLKKRAETGDGAAAWELGTRCRAGDGVPQDLQAAFHWYSRGATLGDREAQNDLGTMLLRGLGCVMDKIEAVRWYSKSAEQGCADAQWNLGKRYLHGDGVALDYVTAYHWLGEAGDQGHTAALCDMGTMYQLGHGVPRNLLAAADFHLVAAGAGDAVACRNLADYRAELEDIALAGSQMASLFLCSMHNRGHGADTSQAMTWAWIRWAQKHCSPDNHPDIVQEVEAAYEFYRQNIGGDDRKSGERTLAALRSVHANRGNRPLG